MIAPNPDTEQAAAGSSLTLPISIADLIAIRGRIIQAWKDANTAMAAVDTAFAAIWDKDFKFYGDREGNRWVEPGHPYDIEERTRVLDYCLYDYALTKLNITKAMTEKARDEFMAKIKKDQTPFEEKQLVGLAQNADKLFRDSSLNTGRQVFNQLTGVRYSGPGIEKKDNLRKVEKVFRVGYHDMGLSYHGTIDNNGARYSNFSGFHFNDLLTACRLIEGMGFTDYSNNMDSFCRNLPNGQRWVDAGYFVVERFLNGNVKVRWNEEKIDVLDRLNAIGSGRENTMPDTMRKRYKKEHFHDQGLPNPFQFFKVPDDLKVIDEKDFAYYPTPEHVAERMVELAEIDRDFMSILEPSVGDGALLRAMPEGSQVTAVEFNHHRCKKVEEEFGAAPIEADFLKWVNFDEQEGFDRVLMNPPFSDRVEAYHVVKAFCHLKAGGILVAIVPDGWFTREDLKATVFRAFLQKYEHKPAETLPAGTFGRTRIVTRIVTLKKPGAEGQESAPHAT